MVVLGGFLYTAVGLASVRLVMLFAKCPPPMEGHLANEATTRINECRVTPVNTASNRFQHVRRSSNTSSFDEHHSRPYLPFQSRVR